jgi:molybdopterin-guanine dinucleotide biosynthesis protein A
MVTGFVLAGGKSSRIGRDKALLPVGDQRLIERVIQRVRPSVERLVVIGGAHNAPQLHDLPADAILMDLKPDHGPLMGIYTGLMHTETPLNLFVPCDMPWIQWHLVELLLSSCRGEVEAVASLHPFEEVQPFPLICHVRACRTIRALLDRGERSLQSLLRKPRTQLVRIEEPDLWRSFTNVNTLADYAKLTEVAVAP